MQKWPQPDLTYRLVNKVNSWMSTVWTFFYSPRLWRTTDFHLMFQSSFQRAAQATLHQPRDPTQGEPQRILVVIPFRDKWSLTEQCLRSLERQTRAHHKIMVALVDNGSQEKATREGLQFQLAKTQQNLEFRHLRYDAPFNFSVLNNWAVRDCADFQADIVFLCNNDIEFLDNDSLLKLVAFTRDQPNAGVVGCTLVYPNRRIQHLFISVGNKIVGSHPHKGRSLNLHEAWYKSPRPVGALTAAISLIKMNNFLRAEGFDEALANCFQDVDLCLKMQKLGLVNWVIPDVVLVHHETQTRSKIHNWQEVHYIYQKWSDFLVKNPFVHGDLDSRSEHFLLRWGRKRRND